MLMAAGQDWSRPAEAAANRGWVGGAAGSWTVASNWNPPGVPQDGDVLFFHRASNGGQRSVRINNLPATVRVAAISSDMDNLTIDGAVTVTKGVWNETIQSQIEIASLYLDADNAELSMLVTGFAPGTIRVSDQMKVRGGVDAHGGAVYAKHLVGSGFLILTTTSFVVEDTSDFEGYLSARLGGRLALATPAFSTACDRARTRVVVTPSARVEFDSSCTNVLASLEGGGAIGRLPTTSGILQVAIVDGKGVFDGTIEQPLALECCGTGYQRLGGQQFKITQIDVTSGDFIADHLSLSPGTITNVGGGTFGGTGTLGNVAINAGSLVMDGGKGIFNSLLFASSGNALFRIRGADPESVSQAATSGVLDLGSASVKGTAGNLAVEFKNGYVPLVGLPLTIISGASDVQGEFHLFPEGGVGTSAGIRSRSPIKAAPGTTW